MAHLNQRVQSPVVERKRISCYIQVNFYENENGFKTMIDRIRKVRAVLSGKYKNVLLFNVLTGLHPDEAQEANMVNKKSRR